MKRFLCLLMFALILHGVEVFANNDQTSCGYTGRVTLSITPAGPGADIMTSHGYAFGSGVTVGGGIGVSLSDSKFYDVLCLVFADTKHNLMSESKVSPFLDCKLGFATDFDKRCYAFLSPAMGIDMGCFSVFVSYDMVSELRITHIGFSFNF